MVEKFMKVVVAAGIAGGVLAAGCLTRPVVSGTPTTNTAFQATVTQQSIDKVDMLFAIDNSASMGDKQDLLAAAVPVLVTRLLNPNCVSTDTSKTCKTASDCSSLGAGANCDTTGNKGAGECYVPGDNGGVNQCKSIAGTKPEFAPVHDLHVGIVSSSLGPGGSPDVCTVSGTDTTHQDDKGHLLNRTYDSTTNGDGPPINNAKPIDGNGGNFLAWLPLSDPKNAGKSQADVNVTIYGDSPSPGATQFVSDFQSLVKGVQQHGCGLEAQLESWYRFLIQPDPFDSIQGGGSGPASYSGVDATLLKMRHDFLRSDSLVAIIQLTDEEDSWSDPMWAGGFGWAARTSSFPGGPGAGAGPIATSECALSNINPNDPTHTGPNNPDCTSCAFAANNQTKPVSGQPIANDPNCQACAAGTSGCPKPGWYTPASPSVPIAAADGLNIRYGEQYMKPRYGLDPQYAIQRYVDGLRSTQVPDTAHEDQNGGSSVFGAYAPVKNCTNPLFAASLPDGSDTSAGTLCNLKLGSRTPDLVFYALIGGVPNSLLTDSSGNFKLDLGAADWVKILGTDPDHFDFTGIDPHMIESDAPRAGLPAPGSSYNLGNDPDNGREWNTLTSGAAIDLEYACTFDLPQPKDCNATANQGACDCASSPGTATTSVDAAPLCSIATRTTQIKGKAYPTVRELKVAKGLGQQAVVASLCAKDTNPADVALPTYGYNPAMQAIVNRLKNALAGQCLPEKLTPDSTGAVPCLVLVIYPNQTDQASGCTDPGMCNPANPSTCGCTTTDCNNTYLGILQRFQDQYKASLGDAGASAPVPVACVFKQLISGTDYNPPTCEGSQNVGWCYVEGTANTGGNCAQAIKFGGSGPPAGTTVQLECIEASASGDAGGQ